MLLSGAYTRRAEGEIAMMATPLACEMDFYGSLAELPDVPDTWGGLMGDRDTFATCPSPFPPDPDLFLASSPPPEEKGVVPVSTAEGSRKRAPDRAGPLKRAPNEGASTPNAEIRHPSVHSCPMLSFLTCLRVPCTVGTAGHKQPRSEAKVWFEPHEAHANMTEVLFFAFLLCAHCNSVEELEAWAKKVVLEKTAAEELQEHWRPLEEKLGGFPLSNRASTLFSPMESAYKYPWSEPTLDRIGLAMQAWRGDGQCDGLLASHLRNHTKRKEKDTLLGKRSGKRAGPRRWKTWSIVRVAELVRTRGREMRSLLKLDLVPEEVPTLAERLAWAEALGEATEAALAAKEAELAEERSARQRAEDAHRKAVARNLEKNLVKRDAIAAERVAAAAQQAASSKEPGSSEEGGEGGGGEGGQEGGQVCAQGETHRRQKNHGGDEEARQAGEKNSYRRVGSGRCSTPGQGRAQAAARHGGARQQARMEAAH